MPPGSHFPRLQAVIHVEFDRMRRHSQPCDVFFLQLDVGVDQVIGKHIARLEKVSVIRQRRKRLIQGECHELEIFLDDVTEQIGETAGPEVGNQYRQLLEELAL